MPTFPALTHVALTVETSTSARRGIASSSAPTP